MKNFPQHLLIFLALCLCALAAFQWVRESRLRQDLLRLSNAVRGKAEATYRLEQSQTRNNEEIKRLDALKNQLAQSAKSNEVKLSTVHRDLQRASAELEQSQFQLRTHKEALDRANGNIKTQNETIRMQNAELLKLSAERNTVISNFNRLARDYKELAERWNRQQADLAAPATNAAAQRQ